MEAIEYRRNVFFIQLISQKVFYPFYIDTIQMNMLLTAGHFLFKNRHDEQIFCLTPQGENCDF